MSYRCCIYVRGLGNARGWTMSDTFYVTTQIFLVLPLSRIFRYLFHRAVAATDFTKEKYDSVLLYAYSVCFSPLTLWCPCCWSMKHCRSHLVPMLGQPKDTGCQCQCQWGRLTSRSFFLRFYSCIDCSKLVIYPAFWKMVTKAEQSKRLNELFTFVFSPLTHFPFLSLLLPGDCISAFAPNEGVEYRLLP